MVLASGFGKHLGLSRNFVLFSWLNIKLTPEFSYFSFSLVDLTFLIVEFLSFITSSCFVCNQFCFLLFFSRIGDASAMTVCNLSNF